MPRQEVVQRVPRLGAEDVPGVLLVHVELLGCYSVLSYDFKAAFTTLDPTLKLQVCKSLQTLSLKVISVTVTK